MRTFLQKIFKIFFPLLAALAVSSVSYAQTIDTGDWLHVKYGARDLVVSSEENITYLARNFQARRLDAEKGRSQNLWGKFSKLTVGADGSIWGLSLKGNLYLLQYDIWQPLELDMEVDNFSVGSDAIYIVSGGKIEALTLSGQKGPVIRYPDLLAVRSFDQLTGNKFVLLQDDGQVIVLTPDERQALDKDVKNVLFVRKDIIAVRKDTGNITFHLLTENSSKQVFAQNSANIKAMSVSADGRIWGAAKRRIHYSPFTIEDLFKKLQHRLHEQNIKFKNLKKTRALRIFTGEDGTFRVNKTGNLELWLPEKEKFVLFPGRVSELSVAGYGQLWGINALGRIFHFRSGRWEQRFGIATSISARAGAVMITDARNSVHRYDWKLKRFKRLKLKARTVAVQNQRVYWILKDRGKISRCNRLKCQNIQGSAKKISISPDGVVFIVDPSGKLLRFDGRKFRLLKTPARKVRDVAAGIGGLPWIIDEKFRVHAGIVKKGQNFILAENKNPYIPKGKVETDNATQGVGVALLDGLVLEGSKLAETADAPEEGFIFRRQVKFRKIPNSEYFFDLSMGRDGRLWALITTGPERVFQFREKTKIFEVYNSSKFPSRRQPFLGLPKTTNVSSIISDREGRIWAVEDASKTVHYQERRNGSFKSLLISDAGDNIQDITVDLEGNVYVAASSIFLKKPRDRRFTKIFEKDGPFLRLSSGPSGTLWAVNSAGQAFELIDDSLVRRARIKAQDIDISVTGVVYVTSPTQTPGGPNEPGAGLVVASGNLLCKLEKWNVADKKSDTVVNFVKHAQYVAVSRDGTPWTTCAPSGDRDVYRGRN